jgi:uncharacterized protein YndB with AHSA1/START domain
VEVERSVVIGRPISEVFAFVSEPRNDPRWCRKVQSVEHLSGEGAGARWAVVHKPVPGRPARRMEYECVAFEPPHQIVWREDDGTDVIRVTYELAETGSDTRMTQRDEAELGAPRLLHPLMRAGIGHDVGRQLKALKALLESAG